MFLRHFLVLAIAAAVTASCGGGGGGGGNPDTTDPVVTSLSGVSAGATVNGSITIVAQATDNTGVTQTRLSVDGTNMASSATGSLTFPLDTTTLANGQHTIVVTASDAAGNTGSSSVTFNVANGGGGTATITGTVLVPVPGGDPVPAEGALVFVPIRGASAVGDPPDEPAEAFDYTDSDGSFTLEGVPAGEQTVQMELGTFQGSVDLLVEDGENTLDEEDTTLEEAPVTSWVTGIAADSLAIKSQVVSACIVAGRPALCYVENDGTNDTLKYALGPNALGSQGDWNVVTVDTTAFIHGVSMAVVDGKPAIAYSENEVDARFVLSGGEVELAISSVPDGTSTWTSINVDQQLFANYSDPSLAIINGRPAIAYSAYVEDEPGDNISPQRVLHYAFTNSTNGAGSWAVTKVDEAQGAFAFNFEQTFVSLAEVAGKPAIAYNYSDSEDQGIVEEVGELRYYIGDSPSSAAGWRTITVDPERHGRGCSLAVIHGKPAILFGSDEDVEPGHLAYANSSQADGGSGWTTFLVPLNNTEHRVVGRAHLSLFNGEDPIFSFRVQNPSTPDVSSIGLGVNFFDSSDVQFPDKFMLVQAEVEDPIDAGHLVPFNILNGSSVGVPFFSFTNEPRFRVGYTALK